MKISRIAMIRCARGAALLPIIALSACISMGTGQPMTAAQITTNLGAACTSAEGLIAQPAAQQGSVGAVASKVGAVVAKDCTKASNFLANNPALINEVNTIAAQLLEAAGAGVLKAVL